MEAATATAEQTQVLIAIATSQAQLAQAVATQVASQQTTVSADALQLAQVLGPGLAPFTPLFWALVLITLWTPLKKTMQWLGIIPKVR